MYMYSIILFYLISLTSLLNVFLNIQAKEEEARKAAYDVLLEISSSLREPSSFSSESSDAPYQKLITMVSSPCQMEALALLYRYHNCHNL